MRSPRLIASASPELAIGVMGVGPPFGVSLDLGRRLESGWFSALSFIDKRTDRWTCGWGPAAGSKNFVGQLGPLAGRAATGIMLSPATTVRGGRTSMRKS